MFNALRTIAVANCFLLSVLGLLLILGMERPAGFIAGGGCWAVVGVLLLIIPTLDPYRHERPRNTRRRRNNRRR